MEELSKFLAEDQESEIWRTKTSQAETCILVHDALEVEWGRGEVVTPQEAKELILQVIFSSPYPFFFYFKILNPSKTAFSPFLLSD